MAKNVFSLEFRVEPENGDDPLPIWFLVRKNLAPRIVVSAVAPAPLGRLPLPEPAPSVVDQKVQSSEILLPGCLAGADLHDPGLCKGGQTGLSFHRQKQVASRSVDATLIDWHSSLQVEPIAEALAQVGEGCCSRRHSQEWSWTRG
jgi:hypothetical protein